MRTVYGKKQKYDLGDYVEYYGARWSNGTFGDPKRGFIVSVQYSMNSDMGIELTYTISEYIGSPSGSIVHEKGIIGKRKPEKWLNEYEYLRGQIDKYNALIRNAEESIKMFSKRLKEIGK